MGSPPMPVASYHGWWVPFHLFSSVAHDQQRPCSDEPSNDQVRLPLQFRHTFLTFSHFLWLRCSISESNYDSVWSVKNRMYDKCMTMCDLKSWPSLRTDFWVRHQQRPSRTPDGQRIANASEGKKKDFLGDNMVFKQPANQLPLQMACFQISLCRAISTVGQYWRVLVIDEEVDKINIFCACTHI